MDGTEWGEAPPTPKQKAGSFTVHWAAQPGPVPEDLQDELRDLAEAVTPYTPDKQGIVATRFGRRVLVAPLENPIDAVDVADVDVSRAMVLTLGGRNPTPAGALLAQVMQIRQEVAVGYARLPETDGPTMSVLQRLLPALQGVNACRVEDMGVLALGRRPEEVAEELAGVLEADEDDEDGIDGPSLPPTQA